MTREDRRRIQLRDLINHAKMEIEYTNSVLLRYRRELDHLEKEKRNENLAAAARALDLGAR